MAEKPDSPVTDVEEQVLVIERVFDAPRELVWRAWSEAELFRRWFGPKGFTTTVCEIDFRVGGVWLHCMRSADGQEHWGTGTYREIVALERFVSTSSLADEHGNAVEATGADVPREVLVTVTFEEVGGKTKMTLRHEGLPAGEMIEGAGAVWNEAFDKLAEYLGKL